MGFADFCSSSTVSDPSGANETGCLDVPGPAVLRDGGRALGADERLRHSG